MPPANSPQPGTEIESRSGYPLTKLVAIMAKPEQPPKPAAPGKDPNAPKRPRGRPRKDATTQPGGQPAVPESSDDELEIEDDDPPEMTPALLSVSMPTDERGKTIYRTAVRYAVPLQQSSGRRGGF